MSLLMHALFWVGFAWLGYVYLGYPSALWLLGLWRSFRPKSQEGYCPSVSVLLAARNEEKDIGWKVSETLTWGYPVDQLEILVASDASEDGTDEVLRDLHEPRLKFIRIEPRVGKNEALNRLSRIATGDLFFFTDANSHIERDCLRRMTRHFADPRVGGVTGIECTESREKEDGDSTCEEVYERYEALIGRLENKLGSVLVCDGSIFCIRRDLYTQLEPDLANDFELPIRIGHRGHALLYEPKAWSSEKATRSLREEFNRRRRICGQGFLGGWRLRECLRGLRTWQFVSHKLLRWFGAIPLVVLLVSSSWLAGSLWFLMLLVFQLAFYSAALAGWLLSLRGRVGSGLVSIPFRFIVIQVAAIVGTIESCMGRRFRVWEIAALSRGRETPAPEAN